MFRLFNRNPDYVFYKDSIHFPVAGRLLVNSKKHRLDREVIEFAKKDSLGSDLVLNPETITTLFKEAKHQGFEPIALLSLGARDVFATLEDGIEIRTTRFIHDENSDPIGAVLVDDARNKRSGVVFDLCIADLGADQRPFITPHVVKEIFEYVKSRGFIPRDLLYINPSKETLVMSIEDLDDDTPDVDLDIPAYLRKERLEPCFGVLNPELPSDDPDAEYTISPVDTEQEVVLEKPGLPAVIRTRAINKD